MSTNDGDRPRPDERAWYYMLDDQKLGPVSLYTLQTMIETKAVVPSTLVWCEGMTGWMPAGGVPQLAWVFKRTEKTEEFALGLTLPGFILFVVLLFVCLPLCWLPWVIDDLKAK